MRRVAFVIVLLSGLLWGAPAASAAPSNDDHPGDPIAALPFHAELDTTGATVQTGEPRPCGAMSSTVWWSSTAAEDGVVRVSTSGSDFDTVVAVYGESQFGLHALACNDDYDGLQSLARASVRRGEPYHIQAGGFFGATGNLILDVVSIPPAPHDAFPGPDVALPFQAQQDTSGASMEPGEPQFCAPIGASVWFSYTATSDAVLVAETLGSDYDTVVTVLTGDTLTALTPVGCSDEFRGSQSRVVFTPEVGTTYRIQVAGFFEDTGELSFSLYESPCPGGPPDDGLITGTLHDLEEPAGPAGEPIHGAGCALAAPGL